MAIPVHIIYRRVNRVMRQTGGCRLQLTTRELSVRKNHVHDSDYIVFIIMYQHYLATDMVNPTDKSESKDIHRTGALPWVYSDRCYGR